MKRAPIRQHEINWGEPESFALVVQQTVDGDRIAADRAKQLSDRKESDKKQLLIQNDVWLATPGQERYNKRTETHDDTPTANSEEN